MYWSKVLFDAPIPFKQKKKKIVHSKCTWIMSSKEGNNVKLLSNPFDIIIDEPIGESMHLYLVGLLFKLSLGSNCTMNWELEKFKEFKAI